MGRIPRDEFDLKNLVRLPAFIPEAALLPSLLSASVLAGQAATTLEFGLGLLQYT